MCFNGYLMWYAGRYDITIPDFVINELKINELLEPIVPRLRSIMCTHTEPKIRTHNVIMAPIGSREQNWHTDDTLRKPVKHRYFTILIHLNTIDGNCGGTELWSREMKRGDLVSMCLWKVFNVV